MADTKKTAYENTERITLISNFLSSIFLGKFAPVDYSDASGTNLFDIRGKIWNPSCLQVCAPNLKEKLGDVVPTDKDLGSISEYFAERFNFNPDCRVISFTGDNPASLIGMRLKPGDLAVSLGTSDTLFFWLPEPLALAEGHVLVNPLDHSAYMTLLCFKNGSLIRERFKNTYADNSWDNFEVMLGKTPRGNFDNFGLFFEVQEILPWMKGEYRFDKNGSPMTKFTCGEIEIRALIEGQFVAKRAHAEDLGLVFGPNSRIFATGGSSRNKSMLQILSDVFNAPVYVSDAANSACLGAAYMAKIGIRNNKCDGGGVGVGNAAEYFNGIASPSIENVKLVCKPYPDADKIYTPMVKRYKKVLEIISKIRS